MVTYGWLSDFLSAFGVHDGRHERFHTSNLAHGDFVALIVAGQVGENACGAGDDVDVCRGEKLDEALQQPLEALHPGAGVRQVAQSPQAVEHEALARVPQVHGQRLHAAGLHDRALVVGAHGQH